MVEIIFVLPFFLFFLLGILASLVKTDLEIQEPIQKILSLYLLIAIGLKGGIELRDPDVLGEGIYVLFLSFLLSLLLPCLWFFLLRKKMGLSNASAIATCYGSVSATTFVTAAGFLESIREDFSGFMVAGLSLMEGPAIITGLFLSRFFAAKKKEKQINVMTLFHEAFLSKPVFILLGSLFVGFLIGKVGIKPLTGFFDVPFKGILCLFLLDMGTIVGKRAYEILKLGKFLVFLGIFIPLFQASIGLVIGYFLGLSIGNTFLLSILLASASYIAAPAALSLQLPKANPAVYLTMALGITFPFNIVLGIPFYYWVIQKTLGV